MASDAPDATPVPFDSVAEIARERKGTYKTIDQLSVQELIRRLLALQAEDPNIQRPELAAAILGAAPRPPMLMSGLVDFYEHERRTENAGKDANAMRKWRNPLKAAVATFTDLLGDLRVADVGHEEAMAYLDHWKDRVLEGEVRDDTANKSLRFLRIMLKAHDRRFRVARANPFDGLSVKAGTREEAGAVEFPEAWILEHLAGPNPLPGLNEEARDLVVLCAYTGARPSELTGLDAKHIRTGDPIPHLQIREEGRRLKTGHSRRDLPLLGPALDAARRYPDGFPRYKGKATVSATVNKFLSERKLQHSPAHTLYAFRHAFEGRMTRAKVDNREAAQMMGHSVKGAIGREAYGAPITLEPRLEIAKLIHPGGWADEH